MRDSKMLEPAERERLAALLRDECAHGIGVATHDYVDRHGLTAARKHAMRTASRRCRAARHVTHRCWSRCRSSHRRSSTRCAHRLDRRRFDHRKVARDAIMSDYHPSYPQYGFDRTSVTRPRSTSARLTSTARARSIAAASRPSRLRGRRAGFQCETARAARDGITRLAHWRPKGVAARTRTPRRHAFSAYRAPTTEPPSTDARRRCARCVPQPDNLRFVELRQTGTKSRQSRRRGATALRNRTGLGAVTGTPQPETRTASTSGARRTARAQHPFVALDAVDLDVEPPALRRLADAILRQRTGISGRPRMDV